METITEGFEDTLPLPRVSAGPGATGRAPGSSESITLLREG